jgi:hypothetical protein
MHTTVGRLGQGAGDGLRGTPSVAFSCVATLAASWTGAAAVASRDGSLVWHGADAAHLGGRIWRILDLWRVEHVHEGGREQQAHQAGHQARLGPRACTDRTAGTQHAQRCTPCNRPCKHSTCAETQACCLAAAAQQVDSLEHSRQPPQRAKRKAVDSASSFSRCTAGSPSTQPHQPVAPNLWHQPSAALTLPGGSPPNNHPPGRRQRHPCTHPRRWSCPGPRWPG